MPLPFRPIMGIETEFAIAPGGDDGLFRRRGAWRMMRRARRDLVTISDLYQGVFTASGARFYIDQGGHPEWCTPECGNPDDLVRHVRAGERLLRGLADRAGGVVVFAGNVHANGTTWGSHESHLHRLGPRAIMSVLTPHLASRYVYGGAGGLDLASPGIRPSLSSRAMLLTTRDTEGPHPLMWTSRDESHCRTGYRRAHIVAGDSLMSDRCLWLRVATTALIIAVLENDGLSSAVDLPKLHRPSEAVRLWVSDLTLTATAKLRRSGAMRAIDVQRAYLEWVRERVGRHWMPPWAGRVVTAWETMLDDLEAGFPVSSRICDWAIKVMLFRRCLERRGTSLSEVIERTNRLEAFLSEDSTYHAAIAQREQEWLTPHRDALLELDFRFAALRDGLFGLVAKHLDTGVAEVDRASILMATTTPPADTRAALRSRMVRRFAGPRRVALANWDRIIEPGRERTMAIKSPFATSGRWGDWTSLDARYSGVDRSDSDRLLRLAQARCAMPPGEPPVEPPVEPPGEAMPGGGADMPF